MLMAAGAVSAVNPPTRYIPAPKGRSYLLVYFNAVPSGLGVGEGKDSNVNDTGGPGGSHLTKIKWYTGKYEGGLSLGYGFGPLSFLKGTEAAVSVPFAVRSYKWEHYIMDIDSGTFSTSIHETMSSPRTGASLSDVQVSLLSLLASSPGSGFWMSSALKATLPTGTSAAQQYTKLLHGVDSGGPADGGGVFRLTPAISMVQSISRQRLFFTIECGIPLGKETFTVKTPDSFADNNPGRPYSDSSTEYSEVFQPSWILAGTLGMETTLDLFGVTPGFEITFRQYDKTKWTENGRDGLATTGAAAPIHTAEFLNTSGWALGNIPFKSTTELEFALTGSKKLKTNDLMKGGLFYIWNTYGSMIGFKFSFTNLFEAVSDEEQLRNEGPGAKALEVNNSPVFDAPPPPSGRILTAATTPVGGSGVSEETLVWTGKEIRRQLDKLSSYTVMSDKGMAQLADTPCGDAECGTRYGRALKQQAMVVGRLEKSGAGFVLTLKMIDVSTGKSASTASAAGKDLNTIREAIPGLLQKLTSPPEPPVQQNGSVR